MKEILTFHNWKQLLTTKGVIMLKEDWYIAYGNYCNKFFREHRETK